MRRAILVVCIAAVVGCGQNPDHSYNPAEPGMVTAAPLTPDQRVAWQKLRRRYSNSPPLVMGYIHSAGGWLVRIVPNGGGAPRWRDAIWFPWGDEDTAKELASDPDVEATALVDLVGGDDPVVLAWFHDDGTHATKSTSAPTPELEKSLRQYLHSLQTRAGDL